LRRPVARANSTRRVRGHAGNAGRSAVRAAVACMKRLIAAVGRLSGPFGLRLTVAVLAVIAATSASLIAVRGFRPDLVTIAETGPAGATAASASIPAPDIQLSTTSVPQGGAFAVEMRSPNVAAASARFNGHDYPMVSDGSAWFALLGVGQPVGSVNVLATGDYPVDVTYQFADSRTVHAERLTVTVTATDFPVDAISVSEEEAGLLDPELEASEAAKLREAYSAFTPVRLWQDAFSPPAVGATTTVFGARRSYQGGPADGSHAGIDIAVPFGTRVSASATGRVAWVGELPDRGRGVIVNHGLGVFTGYFHLSQILSQPGQLVNKGDQLGLAGSTGLSTGPHIHWEVVIAETNVDGLLFSKLNLP
jgi:murein DD-endopeptidase MepM/ murein hydrolase activator NlpD